MITVIYEHQLNLGDKCYVVYKCESDGAYWYELLEWSRHFSNVMHYVYKGRYFEGTDYRKQLHYLIEFCKIERKLNKTIDKQI